ncbi:hypothetical protein GH714_014553 [Hevea brasiliensis]|uniref:Enoyl reductase (ER) domain-containing protein n=1 Tax=Hevea brasiliensis TaxID=3981 RepID=A0A6A6KRL3_HEVBR|nr:hypothetical protein GH714_014553 [Hevea brasiliensis]
MRISTGGRRQLAGGKARASFKLQNLLGSDWVAFLPDQNSTSGIPLVAEFALKGSFGASEGMSERWCLVKTGYMNTLNYLSSEAFSSIPQELVPDLQRMISANESFRPTAIDFTGSPFFRNDTRLRALRFLDHMLERDNTQKSEFLKALSDMWKDFDSRVLRYKKNGSQLPEEEHPKQAFGWAARDESGVLSPFNFSRRATGEKDVCFKVLYCGMCHSDLHMVKNEWGTSTYPLVPGHEIVGVVTEVGSKVEKFKVGDKVGVGCIVGSCHSCHNCTNNLENYCAEMILTYGAKYYDGTITYGGYSDIMVADEHFIVRIPDTLPLDSTAPLLCAGITVYSPLKYYGLDKPGMHVGVVGLGGLGHMAVKFAKGMGVKVTVISTSPSKKQEAVEHLGADSFLVSHDQDQMKAAMGTMDGIIDTVSAMHPLAPLIGLLKTNGKLVLVGAPEKPLELAAFPLIMGKLWEVGTGGMKETQEMINFAAKHNITADVEVIPIEYVNIAMERMLKADVRYRFVIDIGNTIKSTY